MPDNDQFSEEEAKRRFEAALRGARLVVPQPMKDIPRKWPKSSDRGGETVDRRLSER